MKSPSFLREGPPVDRLVPAGSLRRQEVTVGDIDFVCTSSDAAGVIAHFTSWERADAVLAEGPTKASIWLPGGLQIDLRVLPDHLYGNLLQHFTGSREHNIKLREHGRAQRVARQRKRHSESRDRRRDRLLGGRRRLRRARHAVRSARTAQRPRRDRFGARRRDPELDGAGATCAATSTCTPIGATATIRSKR